MARVNAMPTTTRDTEKETTKTTLRLPASLLERAKIRAIKEHRTLQEIVADAITTYLKTPVARMGDAS
jgi:predicted DNA binding CopG/RHH family protein